MGDGKEHQITGPGGLSEGTGPLPPFSEDISKETQPSMYESHKLVPDPWKHRAKNMCCGSCMWFVEKEKSVGSENTAPIGRCRRRAPTMNGFPVVFETDWCGDHKLDENKVM